MWAYRLILISRALLAQKSGLIAILSQKQAHLIAGAAIGGAGRTDGELNHPAGLIPKTLYGENVMSFQLLAEISLIGNSFLSGRAAAGVGAATVPAV